MVKKNLLNQSFKGYKKIIRPIFASSNFFLLFFCIPNEAVSNPAWQDFVIDVIEVIDHRRHRNHLTLGQI